MIDFRIDNCFAHLCQWNITSKAETDAPRIEQCICVVGNSFNQFSGSIFRLASNCCYFQCGDRLYAFVDVFHTRITVLVGCIPEKSKWWRWNRPTMDLQIVQGIQIFMTIWVTFWMLSEKKPSNQFYLLNLSFNSDISMNWSRSEETWCKNKPTKCCKQIKINNRICDNYLPSQKSTNHSAYWSCCSFSNNCLDRMSLFFMQSIYFKKLADNLAITLMNMVRCCCWASYDL